MDSIVESLYFYADVWEVGVGGRHGKDCEAQAASQSRRSLVKTAGTDSAESHRGLRCTFESRTCSNCVSSEAL
jgi:hypothetical protein